MPSIGKIIKMVSLFKETFQRNNFLKMSGSNHIFQMFYVLIAQLFGTLQVKGKINALAKPILKPHKLKQTKKNC